MVYGIKEERLFNKGYGAYREIVEFCISHKESIDRQFDDESKYAIIMMQDLEVQKLLLELTDFHKNPLSEVEQEYIRSLIETADILKGVVGGYARFYRNMSAENYEAIDNDLLKDKNTVPLSVILSAEVDRNAAKKIYGLWEKIFNSFIALTEELIEEKNDWIMKKLTNFQEFYLSKGIDIRELDDNDMVEHKSDSLEQLQKLTGLVNVKNDVIETLNLLKVNKMKQQAGIKTVGISKHMVFTGNPGTGKTTVARLIAKIYKENGIVSEGQLIETDRAGLVDTIIGGTAQKVKNVVESAIGGVLFIDEAYALIPEDSPRDFGQEAVATLVKLMEDNKDDLVVIVAGYENEMRRFIESNPGLKSRFQKYFEFKDYTADEMHRIFMDTLQGQGYVIDLDAEEKVREIWTYNEFNPDFGNGRGVRNVIESIWAKQANRLVSIPNVEKDALLRIVFDDVPDYKVKGWENDEKKRIGFQL